MTVVLPRLQLVLGKDWPLSGSEWAELDFEKQMPCLQAREDEVPPAKGGTQQYCA